MSLFLDLRSICPLTQLYTLYRAHFPADPIFAAAAGHPDYRLSFVKTPWSTPCMIINDYLYNCHSRKKEKAYWRCHNYSKKAVDQRCRARCVIEDGQLRSLTGGEHNHGPHTEKIAKILRRNRLTDEHQTYLQHQSFADNEVDNLADAKSGYFRTSGEVIDLD